MKEFFNNQRILDIIWKRKFHFIIIGVLAVILAAVFSGPAFITPKFKSSARIYPTTNIFTFSDESETEQMLEVVNSRDIKLRMFDAFDLPDVYGINTADPHYLTYMIDIYNTNVNASKTEFETVEIRVLDEDPQRACNMCDSIIEFYNQKMGAMHAYKYQEVADIANHFMKQKEAELDSISENLQSLRNETEIVDFDIQVEEVTRGYMRSLSENNGGTQDGKIIKKQFDQLAENGINAYRLEKKFKKLSTVVDSLQMVQDVALLEANKHITYCHVVEAPVPADKKSYPVRWLIVALSLISALFAGLVIFLVLDYKK